MSDKVQEEKKVKKTEVLKWSKDDILRFLAVYKKYEELWDTSNENFMRKNVREHNFTRLYRELIGMGFNIRTEEQMKRKIKNLKDAFRNEVNKVKKSKKSGAIADNVYTPKLAWFQEADSFLSNVMSCRESIANVGQSVTTENLIEDDDNDFIEKDDDKNNPNEENDQTSELQNDTLHAASVISQEKVIIKRKHSPMMATETLKNNLTNKVKKNSSSFQNAVSQLHEITQMTTEINDEYECFAKYITSQLKQLPLRSFIVLQEKIQSLITQERLANIGQLAPYPSSSLSSYIYSINSNVDRPNKNIDKDNYEDDLEKFMKINRLMPDKEFCVIGNRSTIRSGTVQCEKDEEDPFDLDKFLEETKHIDNSTNLTKQFKDERDHQRRGNRNKRKKY